MHIALPIGKDDVLMASDTLESLGQKVNQGNNVYISIFPDSKEEADRLFNALSASGTIEMPIRNQPWGDYWGSFKDKYGILWMIDYALPKKGQNQELLITRIFDAPREIVWKAWTEPQRVKQWWGPKVFTAPSISIDLRPGGKYLYCMRSSEGKDYWSTGTFLEVIPPERIILTDSFADENGNIVPATYYGMSPDFPLESKITVTLEEEGDKTKFTLKYDDVSKISNLQDMQQGWNESLDKLTEHLKSGYVAKINPVVHFEMPYENSERLVKFYTQVFGWQMQKLGKDMGEYVTATTTEVDENRMIKKPGAINGGFFPKTAAPANPSVVISVDDIRKSAKEVENAGGKVLGEPMEIPGIGQYVSFTDTEGNRVSLLQPSMK